MCAIHSAFSVGVAANTANDFFGEITCHPFFQAEERGREGGGGGERGGEGGGGEGERERERGRERVSEREGGEKEREREQVNLYIVYTQP